MIETVRDIAFNDPYAPFPGVVNLLKGRMTSSSFAKPVGMVTELAVIIGREDHTNDFR